MKHKRIKPTYKLRGAIPEGIAYDLMLFDYVEPAEGASCNGYKITKIDYCENYTATGVVFVEMEMRHPLFGTMWHSELIFVKECEVEPNKQNITQSLLQYLLNRYADLARGRK